MEKQIYNEKNGQWYELNGDCYLPCLTVPQEEKRQIGVWGQRRLRFLRHHRKVMYTELLTTGKLNSYLVELNNQAGEMFLRVVDQMAAAEGITEQIKAQNQMLWVQRMNNIRDRAEEVVNHDLIYA